jgi:alanyl-tRNA synthetase
MTAPEIRQQFLDFFAGKGHKIVDSAPIVNKDDPTLMFINAGMNQFKDFFLGTKEPTNKRIADTQRCLRVSGKHNDLEEVGRDSYHHTLFEMLGNWSFGDYFKAEAIEWAWELLTEVYKLDKDRIYVSVFEGDKSDNLPADSEAADLWKKYIDPARILYFDRSDNFWEMGDTGPCGPCSEIHVDLRPEADRKKVDGKTLVNADHPQVVEIWNLVFIQFNRKADGSLENLAAQHVDTGMGFERLCMALEAKMSNYETTVFSSLIERIESLTDKKYGNSYADDAMSDIAMRVVADHLRAVSFAIADGCLPSNNGAGYVIRRILRRAVRYYYSFLNRQEPLLHILVADLAKQFENVFPVLSKQEAFVTKVILGEEKSFLKTLSSGLDRLDVLAKAAQQSSQGGTATISGEDAFELYDTFGFPIDLTQLVASERNVKVDMAGFEKALEAQRNRGRAAGERSVGDWNILQEGQPEFVGYDQLDAVDVKILRQRTVKTKKGTSYQVVISKSPFYAEGGGQVGDRGLLQVGEEAIKVLNTTKENDLIVLSVDKLPSAPEAMATAHVNVTQRDNTERNHSATHLLHAALSEVLGDHVQQRGSLVNGDYLRFDFSHFSKVTDEQLDQIEKIVNKRIRQTIPLQEDRAIPIAEAEAAGATMLFGEKYGETVRMITFDPSFSRELCGGTHVANTGSIGQFRITNESAVAAGIRRVEAVTGVGADAYVGEQIKTLGALKTALKNPKDIVGQVEALQEETKDLRKELDRLKQAEAANLGDSLAKEAIDHNGYKLLTAKLPIDDSKAAKGLAFQLEEKLAPAVIVLGLVSKGKPQVLVAISKSLTESTDLHAGNIVKQLAAQIGGGGGGQAFFASAGGSKADQLDAALAAVKEVV